MGVVSFAVRSICSEVTHLIYKKIVVIPMLTYAHLIYALACCIGHVVVGAIFRTVCFGAICGVCFGCWLYFVSNVCVREFSVFCNFEFCAMCACVNV